MTYENRIPNCVPEIAYFNNEAKAREWRAGYGGWIFLADCGEIVWFRFGMTPSQCMTHRAVHGLSGTLV